MTTLDIIHLVGRIIFGAYFALSGYNHLAHLSMLGGYAASKKVSAPKLAVAFTGFLLLFGGLGLVFAVQLEVSLVLLLVFLIPVTFTMHRFWEEKDPMAKMNDMVNFQKNLALVGAILMLLM